MHYKNDFLDYLKEKRYNSKTIRDYSYLLQHFEKYVQATGTLDLKNLSENN